MKAQKEINKSLPEKKSKWETCHICGIDYLESTMEFIEVNNSHAAQYVCERCDYRSGRVFG